MPLERHTEWYCIGEIVFGGVNIGRYSGYLHPVPVWPPVSEQPPNWVQYASSTGPFPPSQPHELDY